MALSAKRPTAKERLLEEVRETGAATKRLNIDIDAETYRRLKVRAAGEDRTVSEIVRGLVMEYLSK